MKLKAVKIGETDFSPYGNYYNMLKDKEHISYCKTEVYEDYMTKLPLIDTLGHLGFTIGAKAPYTIVSMEKHTHTQEGIFCAAEPIVLCVAVSRGDLPPQAQDLCAFILEPADVVCIARNVWHDACHGLGKSVGYYYLATAGQKKAEWLKIDGDAVQIDI